MMFSPAQLTDIVARALPSVPQEHRSAIIGTVDDTGAQAIISFTTENDRWKVTAVARHDWTGDNKAGAAVIYSW